MIRKMCTLARWSSCPEIRLSDQMRTTQSAHIGPLKSRPRSNTCSGTAWQHLGDGLGCSFSMPAWKYSSGPILPPWLYGTHGEVDLFHQHTIKTLHTSIMLHCWPIKKWSDAHGHPQESSGRGIQGPYAAWQYQAEPRDRDDVVCCDWSAIRRWLFAADDTVPVPPCSIGPHGASWNADQFVSVKSRHCTERDMKVLLVFARSPYLRKVILFSILSLDISFE